MHDSSQEPAAWSPSMVAAIVVLAAIAAIGLVALAGSREPEPVADAQPSPTAVKGRGCQAADSDMAELDGPPAARWHMVGTMLAPSSAGAGPGRVDGAGYRRCFAHATTGALFAAVNLAASLTDGPRAGRGALEVYLADGPQRRRLLAATQAGQRIDEAATLQVSAYRIEQLKPGGVVVTLALLVEDTGGCVQLQVPLVWQRDDWRFDPPSVGSLARALPDGPDASFTAWGAPTT